ncbi:MAG: hypothetical protein GY715_20965 [Planctomycetes bacterium]|nr:hypothetical protein [Planctomycetota bacterium]
MEQPSATVCDAPEGQDIRERIVSVGTELSSALRAVIDAIPGAPHRPTALARRLGVSRVLLSRLLNALTKPSPFEVLYHVPGPDSLRAVLAAATEGPTEELLSHAAGAVDAFDRLVRDDFGTRGALEAMVSAQLPDTRERFETSSRYDVFKGMSQLLGVQAEVWVSAMMLHPTVDKPDRLDVGLVHGALGLRCLRPDAPVSIRFGSHGSAAHAPTELESLGLERFCRNPPATLRAAEHGGEIVHTLEGRSLGRRSLADMLAADLHRDAIDRYASPDPRNKRGGTVLPDLPVKVTQFDLLLHPDVFPGSDPEVVAYNTCLRGPASVNDPTRDIDRISLHEQARRLDPGATHLHSADVPRYVDMLEAYCDRLGWNLAAFRVFRVRIQYPVYGWQIFMAFDAPPAPGR